MYQNSQKDILLWNMIICKILKKKCSYKYNLFFQNVVSYLQIVKKYVFKNVNTFGDQDFSVLNKSYCITRQRDNNNILFVL